jgi:hypothetical protein
MNMMIRSFTILAAVVTLFACARFTSATPIPRYVVTPLPNGSAVMLDQTTAETWRLSELGWVPIARLPAGASENDPLGIRGPKK